MIIVGALDWSSKKGGNKGNVTVENVFEVAQTYNDLVKYIPNLD